MVLSNSTWVTKDINPCAPQVKPSDVDVLLKGGGALDITSVRKKPKEWIPDAVWLNVVALSAMDAFRCARPARSHVSLPDHRAAGCLRPRVEERLMRQAPQRPVE